MTSIENLLKIGTVSQTYPESWDLVNEIYHKFAIEIDPMHIDLYGNIYKLTNFFMTKVISLEASKVLQEYMPEETEKVYLLHSEGADLDDFLHYTPWDLKTLNLEEAIDLLPWEINGNRYLQISKCPYNTWSYDVDYDMLSFGSFELIEAVESMLLHLAENNLLTK